MSEPHTYEAAGVAALEERAGFRALLAQLAQTFALRGEGGAHGGLGRSLLDFGAYASVLDIGGQQALAISTDGVGTKAVVAQLVDRYDTVGIDCVAMNVNDVLCVGAEPVSMVDYIAVEGASGGTLRGPQGERGSGGASRSQEPGARSQRGASRSQEPGARSQEGASIPFDSAQDRPQGDPSIPQGERVWPEGDRLLEELGKGLLEGARQARISIPGGEVSQMGEVIRSERPGYGFDLAGTCVGLVDRERIVAGQDVRPGQAVVGLASSGIHSNGLTLARGVLLRSQEPGDRSQPSETGNAKGEMGNGVGLDARPEELGGRSVGEELLEPTRIYVAAAMPVLREGLATALAHITSGGLLNLSRVPVDVGFEITWLPQPQGIFRLIQRSGGVPVAEMYRVYNMGVGFCVVCEPDAVSRVIEHAEAAGVEAWEIGRVVADARPDGRPSGRVWLRPLGLVGERGVFAADE